MHFSGTGERVLQTSDLDLTHSTYVCRVTFYFFYSLVSNLGKIIFEFITFKKFLIELTLNCIHKEFIAADQMEFYYNKLALHCCSSNADCLLLHCVQ